MAKKYIDAEKLKAHIEAIMEILWDRLPDADKEHPTDIELRMYIALKGLIDDLDSLQQEQPEMDFEKEWDEFEDWMESYITSDYPTYYTPKSIARHFYELGLNARKEE